MSDAALPNPIPPLDASPEITELERLAKAATPGPWRAMCEGNQYIGGNGKLVGASILEGPPRVWNAAALIAHLNFTEELSKTRFTDEDADFIAAANPETILKLLGLLRRLGEREARMRGVVDAARRFSSDTTDDPDMKIERALHQAVAALAAGKEGE